ncbi:hypothetical protein [Alkalihalobacillus sp. TS-13]|uniref:hypothetical protein n=1 Tax=Alkalihalobacillus sp. TS-13 TaxID=2842455 RepID=UPI001C86914E|nr:hypothetical protein [Alkalihalobacillus sp. TS-13]
MIAWLSLTKKELRLGFISFLIPVIAFIAVAAIATFFGYRAGYTWEVLAVVSVVATGMQVFYLTYYLLSSLQSERKKLHLWLHNPLPAYALLLAKVVAGLFSMIVTLMLTVGVFFTATHLSDDFSAYIPWSLIYENAWIVGLHYFMFAIDLAVWFLFYWMIYLLLTRYIAPFFSFVVTFIIVIVTSTIYGWFTNSLFYHKITRWGEIDGSEMLKNFQIDAEISKESTEFATEIGGMSVYMGEYVFGIAVALLLFFVASWMLDRKVEV